MQIQRAALGVLLLGFFQSSGFGQSSVMGQLNPLDPNTPGLRLTDVSISYSYFSQYYPGAFGSLPGLPVSGSGGAGSVIQGSASFGWSKLTEKSTVSISYTPSYARGFEFSSYHSLNQSLGVMASRKLTSKLTLMTSFQGLVTDFSQLLFAPTSYDNLAGTSATFDEFASGILTGQSTNLGLSQLLALAPVNGSPQTAFLYGGREMSAAASVSLLYSWSSRSSFDLSVEAMRTQFLSTGSAGNSLGPASLIPETTLGSANLGWSYSLTPRTTLGVNVSSNRVVSKLEDAYSSQISGSIGRTLTTHWFAQAMFGVGYINPVRQTFAVPPGTEPEFSASIGYKFKAQTLLGSYSRMVSDSYGLNAYATQGSSGAWTWSRPGSSISLGAGFGYSHLSGSTLSNTTSWTGHAGFTKRLQSQLSMNATYSYAHYPERVTLGAPNLALSGVMVGLSWSPSVRR